MKLYCMDFNPLSPGGGLWILNAGNLKSNGIYVEKVHISL